MTSRLSAAVIHESYERPIQGRMTLVSLSAGAFCALATLLHIASIAVVVARVRRPRPSSAVLAREEGVSIVRPLCGIENFSEATLASSFGLDYRHYEILFCVAQPHDPVGG